MIISKWGMDLYGLKKQTIFLDTYASQLIVSMEASEKHEKKTVLPENEFRTFFFQLRLGLSPVT